MRKQSWTQSQKQRGTDTYSYYTFGQTTNDTSVRVTSLPKSWLGYFPSLLFLVEVSSISPRAKERRKVGEIISIYSSISVIVIQKWQVTITLRG